MASVGAFRSYQQFAQDLLQSMAMKSERSQVQESDFLADKIEKVFVQLKPYLPLVLGVILAAVVGMLGYGIYFSQVETRAARAWTDFYFSDTQPQNLEAISKDFADTSAGLWARITAGDANMAKATEKWNIDRNLSDQFFQQAAEDYRAAATLASEPFAKSRGLQGLAQALEGLGEREEAILQYKKLAAMSGLPADSLSEVNQRIQWLESRSGEAFYSWYVDRRISPLQPSSGGSFPNLPSLPDIDFKSRGSLPSFGGDLGNAGGTPPVVTEKPADTSPSEPPVQNTSIPTGEAPAPETPVPTDKP
jgi:hypothetical protein